jgi:hypothetical protein
LGDGVFSARDWAILQVIITGNIKKLTIPYFRNLLMIINLKIVNLSIWEKAKKALLCVSF